MAGARGGQRPAPDPTVYAPSGEAWASVRAHFEAGDLPKQSVARLAGIAESTLRGRAKREGWAGASAAGSVRAVPSAGEGSPREAPPRGERGRFVAREGPRRTPAQAPSVAEVAFPSADAMTSPAAAPPPDPRTASGRAALVDQLYGLFAAQLAVAGGEDGLGGGLEQRMRSLATFAKTLDALVDLDKRLGVRPETEGSDFDAYRTELERCLAGLVGGGT